MYVMCVRQTGDGTRRETRTFAAGIGAALDPGSSLVRTW